MGRASGHVASCGTATRAGVGVSALRVLGACGSALVRAVRLHALWLEAALTMNAIVSALHGERVLYAWPVQCHLGSNHFSLRAPLSDVHTIQAVRLDVPSGQFGVIDGHTVVGMEHRSVTMLFDHVPLSWPSTSEDTVTVQWRVDIT